MIRFVIINLCITIFSFSVHAQEEYNIKFSDSIVYRAFDLMGKDSLALALDVIEAGKKIALDKKDKHFQARLNSSEALFYYTIGENLKAEQYYLKSLNFYEEKNEFVQDKLTTLINLGIVYSETKNYKKQDSIILIAKKNAKPLNNEYQFFVSEMELFSLFKRKKYSKIVDVGTDALKNIDEFDFSSISKRKAKIVNEVTYFMISHQLAIALIETKRDYERAYSMLKKYNKYYLKDHLWIEHEYSYLNREYLYRYFLEYKKDKDSAIYYSNEAKNYAYISFKHLEQKNVTGNQLLFENFKNKKELDIANLENAKIKSEAKARNYILVLVLFLMVLLAILMFYYKRSLKFKRKINTLLLKRNKRLLQLDNEKTQFYSVMAHELRTPLYTITSMTKLLKKETIKAKQKNYIDKLHTSGHNLLNFINNILFLTKINLKETILIKDKIDLFEVMESIHNFYNSSNRNENLSFSFYPDSNIHRYVFADKQKITQIINNLITNAITHTEHGKIVIILEQLNFDNQYEYINFSIKHSGEVVPEEEYENLFRITGRTDINTSTSTGLNLFITKKLVELMQSEILIQSKPDLGTTIGFTLRLEKWDPINLKKKVKKEGLSGVKVLVVDDNLINLTVTKRVIEDAGGRCTLVNRGIKAIQKLKNSNFDIMLLDINMPELDGYETAKEIRKFNSHLPIIALTAVDYKMFNDKAVSSGINQIVSKPFNTNHLIKSMLSQLQLVKT